MKYKIEIGDTINGFKIVDTKTENKRGYLYCECLRCNNKKWIRRDSVVGGKIVSCGCYNAENNLYKQKDITNVMFNHLKAIEPTGKRDSNGCVIWKCECDCGETKYVSYKNLEEGLVKSCGCIKKDIFSQNGAHVGAIIRDNYCIDGTNINNLTMHKQTRNISGQKGVIWKKDRNKWEARIKFKGKNYYLGRYEDLKEAIQVREIAEEKIFGEFLKWYNEVYKNDK